MAANLGIYFGPKVVSVVECDGKKVLKNFNVAIPRDNSSDDQKVPEEIKITAVLRDEFLKQGISAKEANIAIAGKDLVVRSFNMAALPSNEMAQAVKFEAKKYTPFKIDEMVADFQHIYEKNTKSNLVLFAGIKKDILERYLYVLKHLSLGLSSVEYSAFSSLRLLNLAGVKDVGVSALLNVELLEEDEINFLVLENGFPLFARDILMGGSESQSVPTENKIGKNSFAENLEKLKVELRISLDFYLRKFPTKNIKKFIILGPEEANMGLESFLKERGFAVTFLNVKKIIDKPIDYSLSFYKAYSCALAKTVKASIKLELSPEKQAQKAAKAASQNFNLSGFSLEAIDFSSIIRNIVIGGFVVGGVYFGLEYYKIKPRETELAGVIAQAAPTKSITREATLTDLQNKQADFEQRIMKIDKLVKKRLFLTKPLDTIARLIPQDMWLEDFTYRISGKNIELILTGIVYKRDVEQERQVVNSFRNALEEDVQLKIYFPYIMIESTIQSEYLSEKVTKFIINCKNEQKK